MAGLLGIGLVAAPTKGSAFTGVANDLPVSALTGWTQCYVDTYDNTGLTAAGVLSACTKANLMLACRPTGSDVLTVAAHAAREDVTFDTGTSDTPHTANGVAWYFNDDYAWGFAAAGDSIDLNICDISTTNADQRLCWHTQQAPALGGWRCGSSTNLNSSPAFERIVFEADTDPSTCDPTLDGDGDGVCDVDDNCVATANHDQLDSDGDGAGDACDVCAFDADDDIDADGVCGDVDNCVDTANSDQADADGDDIGDACDTCTDPDHDGFGNADATSCALDNCPAVANADQGNLDGDADGDVCDADDAAGLSIKKLTLKNSPRAAGDSWTAAGELDASASTTFADDVLGGGLTVAVSDGLGAPVEEESFSAAECKKVGKANLKCQNASRSSVRFVKRATGPYRIAITVRKTDLTLPNATPPAVRVTSPVSIDRNDAMTTAACSIKPNSISCKK